MFQWTVQAETTTQARPQDIWKLWTDVSTWSRWSHDLEWSRLEGPFSKGTTGTLKPKGWPVSKFILTDIEEGKSFRDESFLPKTKITFSHHMKTEGSKVHIVHHVHVSGLLAPLLWLTMRPMLKKGLPANVKRLVQMAEK